MYEIKVLTDKEFDSLPSTVTRGSDISDSLGFADPRTGKAYVRYVGYEPLQKYLINHEFEELVTGHEGHEDENGIRHKKFFKQLFAPLLGPLAGAAASAIPGVGPIAGPIVGSAVGGVTNKLTQPKPASQLTPQMQQQPMSSPVTSTLGLGGGLMAEKQKSPMDMFSFDKYGYGFDPEKQNNPYAGFYQGRDPFTFKI